MGPTAAALLRIQFSCAAGEINKKHATADVRSDDAMQDFLREHVSMARILERNVNSWNLAHVFGQLRGAATCDMQESCPTSDEPASIFQLGHACCSFSNDGDMD